MVDLHATIALRDLEKFDKTFGKRKDNFCYLIEKTRDLQDLAWFIDEEKTRNEIVAPHAFTITIKDPNYRRRNGDLGNDKNLIAYLEDSGIQTKRSYGSMPTQHKAFTYLGYKLGDFPNAEHAGNHSVHFGIHQKLNKEDLDYSSDVLHKYFEK